MTVKLAVAAFFLLALTASAGSAETQAKANPSSSPWTVVPAQDCDEGVGPLRELSVSQDGRFVAALRHDACLWRARDGRRIKRLDFAQPVVFAGNLLFLGDKIFDPAKLAVVGTNKLPPFGSDSRNVFAVVGPTSAAINGFDRKVLIYDWSAKVTRSFAGAAQALSSRFAVEMDASADEHRLTIRWTSLASPTQQGSFRLSRNEGARLVAIGGDRVILREGSDGEIEIWGIPESRRIASLPAGSSDTLGISPDGKTMATYENLNPDSEEYRVVIWNVDPLRKTSQVRVKLTDSPRELMFDEAAKTLVVCDDRGACAILRRP